MRTSLVGLHLQETTLPCRHKHKAVRPEDSDQPTPRVLYTLTAAWLGSSVPDCGKRSLRGLPLAWGSCRERDLHLQLKEGSQRGLILFHWPHPAHS